MNDPTEILYLNRDVEKLLGRLKAIRMPANPHPTIKAALANIEACLTQCADTLANMPHEPDAAQLAEQLDLERASTRCYGNPPFAKPDCIDTADANPKPVETDD